MKNISKSSFTSMTNAIPTRWHYCMNFPPYMRFVTIVKYFFVLHAMLEKMSKMSTSFSDSVAYLKMGLEKYISDKISKAKTDLADDVRLKMEDYNTALNTKITVMESNIKITECTLKFLEIFKENLLAGASS